MKAVRTNEKGFSLVELMIVVAIIGILSTIAVPNFKKFSAKAKQTEAKAALAAIYSANKSFHAEWNVYRADFRDIGYSPEGRMLYMVGWPNGTANPDPNNGGPGNFVASTNGTAGAGTCVNAGVANCAFTATAAAGRPAGFSGVAAVPNCQAVTAPAAGNTFVAEANGGLGNATTDVWTVNQTKVICNLRDGTL
jgi:type IV pilus assembly protein PilA